MSVLAFQVAVRSTCQPVIIPYLALSGPIWLL